MSLITTLIGIQRQKEIHNLQEKLSKATRILHTKNEIETLDLALEKIIEEFEQKKETEDTQEKIDIDVHTLNRIPPKKGFTVKANFKVAGRRKPMKYDFTDFVEDEE